MPNPYVCSVVCVCGVCVVCGMCVVCVVCVVCVGLTSLLPPPDSEVCEQGTLAL